ncbi:cyclic nucleotide-binding domain-containing protein [Laspinema olomoucense]|uniref:cyclic nucleotide-binding domain-containing protein n=1 Tax=Laspinema olomoucense TaxID=3231600 RepID=UPI0021BAD3B6|nr:cyclic nucleotide-binding domain-containing protein [Laspinema sp. D3d]MCT7973032.1 cyclic nucleotide-binding domain-containing protein [Laspinema sp. D3d]
MVSIRKIIPALIVLPIFAAVGVTGWLSFRSGQQSVEMLVRKLSEEVSDRIESEVVTYMKHPQVCHELTLAAIRSGNLNAADFGQLERYFWHQMRWDDSIIYSYYGNEAGEFIGINVIEEGKRVLRIRQQDLGSSRRTYELDSQGNRVGEISVGEYDPRTRPWYQNAKTLGKITWSPIYKFQSQDVLGITAVAPVYQPAGTLQGVFAINISLAQLSDFLNNLEISPAGAAFIVERSGTVVASSVIENLLVEGETPETDSPEDPNRLLAVESVNPTIQGTARELLNRFNNLNSIQTAQTFKFSLNGKMQLVAVNPIQDGRGLDWLIVAVVPESDFMGYIHENTRRTALLSLGALVAATILGIAIAKWLIQPILRLSATAQDIELGKFDPNSLTEVVNRSDEVGQLARIFQDMANKIYAREQGFKTQLSLLQNETDKAKKAMLLTQMSDSNYYQQLLIKSKRTRSKAEEFKKIDIAELLKKVSYFQGFTESEIQGLIDMGYRKILYPGEYVCREDEAGDAFYIILEGSVEIFVEKINKFLTNLGVGTFFGELSLLLGIPRTATVRTREDTVLFVLDREGLQKLLRNYKDLAEQIAQALHEHKAELESRKELLQKMGLLEDEEGFNQNPLGWIRNRMATLFGL